MATAVDSCLHIAKTCAMLPDAILELIFHCGKDFTPDIGHELHDLIIVVPTFGVQETTNGDARTIAVHVAGLKDAMHQVINMHALA